MNYKYLKLLIPVLFLGIFPAYSMQFKDREKESTFLKINDDSIILQTSLFDVTHLIEEPDCGLTFEGEKVLKNEQCHNIRKKIVSFIKFVIREESEKHYVCEIKFIQTRKKKRNQGYASFLLQNLEKEMNLLGCTKIKLYAETERIPFYEKRGFHRIDFSSNWMEKELGELNR
jgi:GNAT superfamily N-acetyltransferase